MDTNPLSRWIRFLSIIKVLQQEPKCSIMSMLLYYTEIPPDNKTYSIIRIPTSEPNNVLHRQRLQHNPLES